MKTLGYNSTFDIRGIYVTPANKIIGSPLFRHQGQEYRENQKYVELWQKNGDGRMHLKKRWRNSSIAYIEYSDLPNTWVEPRSHQQK
jgi:hypothetical protein